MIIYNQEYGKNSYINYNTNSLQRSGGIEGIVFRVFNSKASIWIDLRNRLFMVFTLVTRILPSLLGYIATKRLMSILMGL